MPLQATYTDVLYQPCNINFIFFKAPLKGGPFLVYSVFITSKLDSGSILVYIAILRSKINPGPNVGIIQDLAKGYYADRVMQKGTR